MKGCTRSTPSFASDVVPLSLFSSLHLFSFSTSFASPFPVPPSLPPSLSVHITVDSNDVRT